MQNPKSLGTHDGTFHADEVTAAALLVVFRKVDQQKIFRTRDPSFLEKCEYVCDVGGVYDPSQKRFDHHQVEYKGPLSSAGMVWKYLHDTKEVSDSLYEYVNHQFLLGVDAHDTGKTTTIDLGVATFSQIISSFSPIDQTVSSNVMDDAFFKALSFAEAYIERVLQKYEYVERCREKVAYAMAKQEKVLIFDEALPWIDLFFAMGGESHPASFGIMPSGEHWKLRGIPPDLFDRMGVRVPLPASWAGLMGEELAQESGIKGAIFCHKGRFISVWNTKEEALQALRLIESESPSTRREKTIFKKIIDGELPAKKVFENSRILVIEDIAPAAPVHLLIIPKKEIKWLQDVRGEDTALIMEVIHVAQGMAKKFEIEDGYRLLTNNGTEGGQTIFHLHFHLIGGRSLTRLC